MSHQNTHKNKKQRRILPGAISIIVLLGFFGSELAFAARRSPINTNPPEIWNTEYEIIADTINDINRNMYFNNNQEGVGIGLAADNNNRLRVGGDTEITGTLKTNLFNADYFCDPNNPTQCYSIADTTSCPVGGTNVCSVDQVIDYVWTKSGNDIQYSSGSVGIGVQPESGTMLHVGGDTKIEGHIYLSENGDSGDAVLRRPNNTGSFFWEQLESTGAGGSPDVYKKLMQLDPHGKLILLEDGTDSGLQVNGKTTLKQDVTIGTNTEEANLTINGKVTANSATVENLSVNENLTINSGGTLTIDGELNLNAKNITGVSAFEVGNVIQFGKNKIHTNEHNPMVFEKEAEPNITQYPDSPHQGFHFRVTKSAAPGYEQQLFIKENGDIKTWGENLEIDNGNIALRTDDATRNFIFQKNDQIGTSFQWKQGDEDDPIMALDNNGKLSLTKETAGLLIYDSNTITPQQDYGLYISKKNNTGSGEMQLKFAANHEYSDKSHMIPSSSIKQGGLVIESNINDTIPSLLIKNKKGDTSGISFENNSSQANGSGEAYLALFGKELVAGYGRNITIASKNENQPDPGPSLFMGKKQDENWRNGIILADNSDIGFTEIISGEHPLIPGNIEKNISVVIAKNLEGATPSTGVPQTGGTSQFISGVGGIRIHSKSENSEKIPGLVLTNSSLANPAGTIGTGILFQHATTYGGSNPDVGYIASLSGGGANNGADFLQMQSLQGDMIFGAGESNDKKILIQSENFKVEQHKLTIDGTVVSKWGRYHGGDQNRAMVFQITDTNPSNSNSSSKFHKDVTGFHFRLDPDPANGIFSETIEDPNTGKRVQTGFKEVAYLDHDGGFFAHQFLHLSDRRYKKNITPIQNALEKISQINGVEFEWKKEANKAKGKKIGVIAQDVEKVFPEAVETDKNGRKTVEYSELVAPLIEAVKELKTENEELQERVQSLKEKKEIFE